MAACARRVVTAATAILLVSGLCAFGEGPVSSVQALGIDPATPSTIYAALSSGVFKSLDAGGTWIPASHGLSGDVWSLVIDPKRPTTLYAATSTGVFKSTDAAATWSAVLAGRANLAATFLAVAASASSTVYVITLGGLFRTTDGGASWRIARSGLSAGMLAVDPSNAFTVYAVNGAALWKSLDGGGTWSVVSLPLPSLGMSLVNFVAIDPASPSTLYVSTAGCFFSCLGGVLKSIDRGRSWDWGAGAFGKIPHALAIAPSSPSTVYVADDRGGFRTDDAGSSWTVLALLPEMARCLAVDPTSKSIVYAGTYSRGIYKTTDGGASWAAANDGLIGRSVHLVAPRPSPRVVTR